MRKGSYSTKESRIYGSYFVRPMPLDWVSRTIQLPGKAFHVGVIIWYQAGIQSSHSVRLSMKRLREFGISRWSAYRGLAALRSAGIIEIRNSVGRLPIITILDF